MMKKTTKKECLFKASLNKPWKRVIQTMFVLLTTSGLPSVAATGKMPINEIQQQQSVKGRVVDSEGTPLPGVSVVAMGTSTGTLTDNDGNFTLANIPVNATIQFSFVGMES